MKKHLLLILATFISSIALADVKIVKSKLSGDAKELPNGDIVIFEPRIDGSCLSAVEDAGKLACSMLDLSLVGTQKKTWFVSGIDARKVCPSIVSYNANSGTFSKYRLDRTNDSDEILTVITCQPAPASDLRAD